MVSDVCCESHNVFMRYHPATRSRRARLLRLMSWNIPRPVEISNIQTVYSLSECLEVTMEHVHLKNFIVFY